MYSKYLTVSVFILFVIFIITACSDAANNATKPAETTQHDSQRLVKISLSPIDPMIAKNTIYPLSATGIYSDNSKRDISSQVAWLSSDAMVADIKQNGLIEGLNSGTAGIRSSLQGIDSDTINITVSDQEIVAIKISPVNPVTVVGADILFRAEGLFSNGLIQDLSNSVSWESSTTNISSFNSNDDLIKGRNIGLAPGNSTITATFSGISSESVLLEVRDANLERIELSLNQSSIGVGTHLAVTATGFYVDNKTSEAFITPLTNNVMWKSSDAERARISNEYPTQGLVYAVTAGLVEISASEAGIISNVLKIVVHDIELESIQIDSSQLDLPLSLRKKFTAIGTYRNQVQQDMSNDVLWLLRTNPVAFVDNSYQRSGLLIPSTIGQTKLTASFQSITSPPVDVNIVDVKVSSVAVTPAAVSLATGLTQQFSVIATLTDESERDVTEDSFWETSNSSTLAVSNALGDKGLVTALAVGEAEVFARYNQYASNRASILAVDATLTSLQLKLRASANPQAVIEIPLGSRIELVAEGVFNDGSIKDITKLATWQSSDSNVASISNALNQRGVINALRIGQSNIIAKFNGIDASPIELIVTEAVLEGLRLSPSIMSLTQGQSQRFKLTGIYSNGPGDVVVPVIWKSNNVGVATITDGNATAISSGVSAITSTVVNRAGVSLTTSAQLWVDISPTLNVFPGTTEIKVNDLLPMSASGGSAPYVWTVSDNLLATIGELSGQLTALRAGMVTVTVTDADQVTSSVVITIVPSITSIAISSNANNNTVLSGDSIRFQALATYSDGNSTDVTAAAVWSLSTNVNNLAVISPTMRYVVSSTAGLTGSIAMTALHGGKSGVASISIIAPTIIVRSATTVSTVLVGDSLQLTATGGSGTYTWSTSNANADINQSTGLLTASTNGSVDAIATDNNGFFGKLTISINPLPNTPPTASAGSNQIVGSGDSVFLSGTGVDSDGTIISYQWIKTSGPNIDLLTPSTANTSFIAPIVSVPTTINFQLTVTDDGNASANASVTVTVNPLPVILRSIRITSDATNTTAGTTATLISGSTVTFQAEAIYSDNSIADITLNSNTVWSLLATPATLATSFANVVQTKPAGAATGSLSMTVSHAGITDTLLVNVIAPTLVINSPIVGPVVGGSAVPYSATGGTLPYTWKIDNTALANIDPTSGSLTPISTGSILLTVSDANGFTGTSTVSIARAANRPPIVSAGPDQTVVSGVPVYLLGNATDSDGSIVTSQWTQLTGTTVILSTPTSQRARFVAPIVSTATLITLTFTSSDNEGAASSASITITVKPASMLIVSDILPSFVDPGLRRCIEDEANTYFFNGLNTPLLDFDQTIGTCTGFFTTTPITDLSGIENLPGLIYFSAPDNQIVDLTPLTHLPNLKTLVLSNNVDSVGNSTILSYALLSRIPALETLILGGNALNAVDIVEISTIMQLIELDINRNTLTNADIVPISKLSNLRNLGLSELPITTVAPFASLSNLERFNLTRTLLGTAGSTGLDKLKFAAPPVRFFNTEIFISDSSTIPCIELEVFAVNNPAVVINPFGTPKPGQAGNCT